VSDGSKHDRIGVTVFAAIGAVPILLKEFHAGVCLLSVSGIFGTLYLSPDLDCKGCYKAKSWHRWQRLRLGWYWNLYAKTIPYHRHWLSHSVLISNFYRVIWLLFPIVFLLGFNNFEIEIDWYNLGYCFVGLELSTILHLILDNK